MGRGREQPHRGVEVLTQASSPEHLHMRTYLGTGLPFGVMKMLWIRWHNTVKAQRQLSCMLTMANG